MDYYNQQRRQPQYEINDEYSMDPEFEMEHAYNNNSEFNYEMESDYELLPELEINDEMEFEQDYENGYGNNELYDEFGMTEGDNYGEMETAAAHQDEMEMELEYVTNEQEFSNWVNEIVVRDHRNKNLRPALRRPLVQSAVRQLSKIASRTLPYLGKRLGGWRGWRPPAFARPVRYPWNRPGYGRRWSYPRPGYPRPYPYGGSVLPPQPPYAAPDSSQSQGSYSSPDIPAVQPSDQDGSFKNFVLDTIKNLTQQIAAGNESLAAIKSSIANSAANNLPAIVQPKSDAPPPEGAPPPPPSTPPQGEFEFEDYEYGMESDEEFEMETEGEISDSESSFSEETEMELASNLLAVRTDQELDHFLGGLLKKAIGAVSGILNTDQGKMLKGILKSVAKKAIPLAGAAAGTFFGGPAGTAIGGKLGNAAAGLFELELEGMSNEDREFETAKAMVRFAGNAARQVADQATGNPREDVRQGVVEAASRFAPGLLMRRGRRRFYDDIGGSAYGGYGEPSAPNGTWYRKGNRIIIENI